MKVTLSNDATARVNNAGYSVVYPPMGSKHYLVSKETAEYVEEMHRRDDNYHFKINVIKVISEI